MSNNTDFVQFQLAAGFFSTPFGRDENGGMLYFDTDLAKKSGIADPFNSPRVVLWNNGGAIGKIELAIKGNRILRVPRDEKKFIDALSRHEFVDSEISPVKSAKVKFVDTVVTNKADDEKFEKGKMVDSIFINMGDFDIEDLGALLGYTGDVNEMSKKISALKDSKPDLFLSYFTEPLKKGRFFTAKLLEKTVVGAVLKRAILKKVVTVLAGSISFEETPIGNNFDLAVSNLMDDTKQGKANILTLIKAKLEIA